MDEVPASGPEGGPESDVNASQYGLTAHFPPDGIGQFEEERSKGPRGEPPEHHGGGSQVPPKHSPGPSEEEVETPLARQLREAQANGQLEITPPPPVTVEEAVKHDRTLASWSRLTDEQREDEDRGLPIVKEAPEPPPPISIPSIEATPIAEPVVETKAATEPPLSADQSPAAREPVSEIPAAEELTIEHLVPAEAVAQSAPAGAAPNIETAASGAPDRSTPEERSISQRARDIRDGKTPVPNHVGYTMENIVLKGNLVTQEDYNKLSQTEDGRREIITRFANADDTGLLEKAEATSAPEPAAAAETLEEKPIPQSIFDSWTGVLKQFDAEKTIPWEIPNGDLLRHNLLKMGILSGSRIDDLSKTPEGRYLLFGSGVFAVKEGRIPIQPKPEASKPPEGIPENQMEYWRDFWGKAVKQSESTKQIPWEIPPAMRDALIKSGVFDKDRIDELSKTPQGRYQLFEATIAPADVREIFRGTQGPVPPVPKQPTTPPATEPRDTGKDIQEILKEEAEAAKVQAAGLRKNPFHKIKEKLKAAKEASVPKAAKEVLNIGAKGEEFFKGQAEKSKGVNKILFNASSNYLNNFHARDKSLRHYVGGMVIGSSINVGLTLAAPLPGMRFVRSAIITGGVQLIMKGADIYLTNGVDGFLGNVITNDQKAQKLGFGTRAEAIKSYRTRLVGVYKLKGASNEEFTKGANEFVNDLSTKLGIPPLNSEGLDTQVGNEGASYIRENIYALFDKYKGFHKAVRDVAAGIKAGTALTTVGFGLEQVLTESIKGAIGGAEKLFHALRPSGLPSVDVTPTPPTPTTPEIGVPPTPTPTPTIPVPEVPHVELPDHLDALRPPAEFHGDLPSWTEFANHYNSLNPDQQKEFIEIMSNPDRVQDLIRWSEAHQPPIPEFEPIQGLIENPASFAELDIGANDTVGQLAIDNGYTDFWDANEVNAALKGLTIEQNRDLLEQATKNAANAQLAVQDLPTDAELVDLMRRAAAGDLSANAQLNEALHWILKGGKLRLLNKAALNEAVENLDLAA